MDGPNIDQTEIDMLTTVETLVDDNDDEGDVEMESTIEKEPAGHKNGKSSKQNKTVDAWRVHFIFF